MSRRNILRNPSQIKFKDGQELKIQAVYIQEPARCDRCLHRFAKQCPCPRHKRYHKHGKCCNPKGGTSLQLCPICFAVFITESNQKLKQKRAKRNHEKSKKPKPQKPNLHNKKDKDRRNLFKSVFELVRKKQL